VISIQINAGGILFGRTFHYLPDKTFRVESMPDVIKAHRLCVNSRVKNLYTLNKLDINKMI
jgi:hypothetical protein